MENHNIEEEDGFTACDEQMIQEIKQAWHDECQSRKERASRVMTASIILATTLNVAAYGGFLLFHKEGGPILPFSFFVIGMDLAFFFLYWRASKEFKFASEVDGLLDSPDVKFYSRTVEEKCEITGVKLEKIDGEDAK